MKKKRNMGSFRIAHVIIVLFVFTSFPAVFSRAGFYNFSITYFLSIQMSMPLTLSLKKTEMFST